MSLQYMHTQSTHAKVSHFNPNRFHRQRDQRTVTKGRDHYLQCPLATDTTPHLYKPAWTLSHVQRRADKTLNHHVELVSMIKTFVVVWAPGTHPQEVSRSIYVLVLQLSGILCSIFVLFLFDV